MIASLGVLGQPKNASTIKSDCDVYYFNPKKFKVWIESTISFVPQVNSVKTNSTDTLSISLTKCSEKLPIIFEPNLAKGFEEALKRQIKPKSNNFKVDIEIKELSIRDNKLPTLNKRIYLTLGLTITSDHNPPVEYVKSVSAGLSPNQYIEKPLARLFRNILNDFFENRKGLDLLDLSSSDPQRLNSGIYTCFNDLKNNNPTLLMTYKIDVDTGKQMKQRYYLVEQKSQTRVQLETAVGFSTGKDQYLGVLHYYLKPHYLKLRDFHEDYYLAYDQVYDYTQANANTAAFGGGLIGAAIGSAAAKAKSPILIDKSDGTLKAYPKKTMKKILENSAFSFEEYEKLIANDNITEIENVLKQLLADGQLE